MNPKTDPVYRYYNFDKFWKYVPANRWVKEILKDFLFYTFPFVFKQWAIYQNWKNAGVFRDKPCKFSRLSCWKNQLLPSYNIAITKPETKINYQPDKDNLAIVIHAFYPDIFEDILRMVEEMNFQNITYYITTPENSINKIEAILKTSKYPYHIFTNENRGRDILPFIKLLPEIVEKHKIVLKLHTKKSSHLNDNNLWRDDMYQKLIGAGSFERNLKIFYSNVSIGMIGPSGHILPMKYYYSGNGAKVHELCGRMGLKDNELSGLLFIAGSMFYARTEALRPVINLNLSDSDFEPEDGQTDATMAHVVERLFASGLIIRNLQLADTDYSNENPVLRVSKVHHFSQ